MSVVRTAGKGKKDRIVSFPRSFRETLIIYMSSTVENLTSYLFESSWKKPYSDRGIRRILEKYSKLAGIEQNISPHKFRHFLFTWLKKKGIDDALIQPYSGHETRQSLEVYSKLSLSDAQDAYEKTSKTFLFKQSDPALLIAILSTRPSSKYARLWGYQSQLCINMCVE